MRPAIPALLVTAVVVMGFIVVNPKAQWRARIIAMKLAGNLPGLHWSEVVAAIRTYSSRAGGSNGNDSLFFRDADEHFHGDIRIDRIEVDNGSCPVGWKTPLGVIWGHRADVRLVQDWFGAENRVLPRLSAVVVDIGAREGLFALDSLARGAEKVWIQPRNSAAAGCIRRTLEAEIEAGRVALIDDITEVTRVELLRVSPGLALGLRSQLERSPVLRAARLFIADGFVPVQSVYATAIEPESPCPVLWQTRVGALWGRANEADLLALMDAQAVESEIYLNEIVGIEQGDIVLDVGGHLGIFTLLSLAEGAARTVVFEPDPGNLACLEKTFADEIESGRVALIDAAAWKRIGTVQFKLSPDALGHESARGAVSDSGELSVRAETIDHVVDELDLERVDYIKMDIEGSERHALAGARRTIERYAPDMALCIYHRKDDSQVVPRLVAEVRPSYEIEHGTGPRAGQIYCHQRAP